MQSTSIPMMLLVLPLVVLAQDTRGKISGNVSDPQGALVAGAVVVVTNTGTSTATRLVTNASGYYEAPLLLPGNYSVAAEAPGFKKSMHTGITLALGEQ